MKKYSAKTKDDAVNLACQDLGITPDHLYYEVVNEVSGLFKKRVDIECYTIEMVQEYIEEYIQRIIRDMEFEVETVSFVQEDMIHVNVNTSNNSILIGKAGVILRALNLVVRNAVQNNFKQKFKVSIDINGYREQRYKKVASMARRFGKTVQRTKTTMKLDPLPADERKVIHQEISKMKNVVTKSEGEGKNRHIVLSYVE